MQIDQRGPGTAVTHPFPQFAQAGASVRGKNVPGMTQVVKKLFPERPISMGSDCEGQRGEGKREVGSGDGNVVEGAGADMGSEGPGEEQTSPIAAAIPRSRAASSPSRSPAAPAAGWAGG
jgi:hypothetical protein